MPMFTTSSEVLVTVLSKDSLDALLSITQSLRKAGLKVDLYPTTDKLDKQLKYADRKGIPYVIIQGPEEVSKNVVKLKDMKAQTQEDLTLEALIDKLTEMT